MEQRGPSGPLKVTLGTLGLLYVVCNGNPAHMQLVPKMERFRDVKGLQFYHDICPTDQKLKLVQFWVLLKYCPGFKTYATDPALQNTPCCPMPAGYVTKQFLLCTTTIEEATVRGNLLYHEDIYIAQLRQAHKDLCKFAVPTFNDQVTNSCIHSGQVLQACDIQYALGCSARSFN